MLVGLVHAYGLVPLDWKAGRARTKVHIDYLTECDESHDELGDIMMTSFRLQRLRQEFL